ncbi:NfeD family protein [Microbacterium pygmaeum]|uniref:Membrane protein implicated in regulation of membrane protease activity n=1 Tax=Microbacterium pygmaeum TaxID=370764 RepID=A0A1G8B9L2_9MICO|nr:NfeD family protein [Microbacterium pygmaeum]SDH29290.1 Membrane protein implicated in regulation of membrane protease activity [Microbacterium pygmaeum]
MELIQTIEQFAWIGWLVLILVFLVIEMLSLDFTFLMLSIGGLAGLGSDLIGAPIWLQIIIAAAVAAVLVLFLRPPLLARLRRGEDPTPTNVAALIGLSGRVLSTVSAHAGEVKLSNGDTWTARGDAADELEPGTVIRVSRIDGATAYVRPADLEGPRA